MRVGAAVKATMVEATPNTTGMKRMRAIKVNKRSPMEVAGRIRTKIGNIMIVLGMKRRTMMMLQDDHKTTSANMLPSHPETVTEGTTTIAATTTEVKREKPMVVAATTETIKTEDTTTNVAAEVDITKEEATETMIGLTVTKTEEEIVTKEEEVALTADLKSLWLVLQSQNSKPKSRRSMFAPTNLSSASRMLHLSSSTL
jgi:hypothetical protein